MTRCRAGARDIIYLRNLSSDLVEGRIGNLVGLNLGSSLFFEGFQHGWISPSAISLRVLFLIPQTDSHNLRSVRSDECDFILKAFLLSKQENDLLFDSPRELRNAVGFKCK